MNALSIVDFSGVHTLPAQEAAATGLLAPEVRALPPGSNRAHLFREAVDGIQDSVNAFKPDEVLFIEVGQARGRLTDFFEPLAPYDSAGLMLSGACSSGVAALALAGRVLSGTSRWRAALIVGASRPTPGDLASFGGVGALAPGSPTPLDEQAEGTALGSFGGALLVARDSLRSKATLISAGQVATGQGARSNAADQASAINRCLQGTTEFPRAVIAHATGTAQGDREELDALSRIAFERGVGSASIVAYKHILGHAVQAAGIASAVTAMIALRSGFLPGTPGLVRPMRADARLELPSGAQRVPIGPQDTILINAFGFGGNNASALLGPAEFPSPQPPIRVEDNYANNH